MDRFFAIVLLVSLSSPMFAAHFSGQTYDRAASILSGRSLETTYDGSLSRTSVQIPVANASAAASPTIQTSPTAPTTNAPSPLAAAPVPTPEKSEKPKKNKLLATALLSIAGGVIGGGRVGFFIDGPIGAVAGALIGFAIGLTLFSLLS